MFVPGTPPLSHATPVRLRRLDAARPTREACATMTPLLPEHFAAMEGPQDENGEKT